MKNSKLINLFLLAVGLVVLIFFIRNVNLKVVLAGLKNVNLISIALILFLTFLTIVIKAFRWKFLVAKTTKVNISSWFSFLSIISGVAAGSVTPSRAGEVAKPFMLKSRYGVRISKTLSCVFSERAFDLLALILLFFIGLLMLPIKTQQYNQAKGIFFVLFVFILLGLFVFPKDIYRFLTFMINRLSPDRWNERLLDLNRNIFSGFLVLRDKKVLFFVGATSLLSMAAEAVRLFFVFSLFGLSLNFWLVMFAFSTSIVFGLLTMVPGGIGTTEMSQAVIIASMVPLFAQESLLKGAIILDRFFAYYLLIGLGGLILLVHQKWKRKI